MQRLCVPDENVLVMRNIADHDIITALTEQAQEKFHINHGWALCLKRQASSRNDAPRDRALGLLVLEHSLLPGRISLEHTDRRVKSRQYRLPSGWLTCVGAGDRRYVSVGGKERACACRPAIDGTVILDRVGHDVERVRAKI